MRLVGQLAPSVTADTPILLDAASRLAALLAENPDLRADVHQQHGLVQVVAALDAADHAPTQLALLRVLRQLVSHDAELQEAWALVGGMQAVLRLTAPGMSVEVRLEAIDLVRSTAGAHRKALQAFIVCRGIPALVAVLATARYREHHALQLAALDCVLAILAVSDRDSEDSRPANGPSGAITAAGAARSASNASTSLSGGGSTLINRPQVLLLMAMANLLPPLVELLHSILTDTQRDLRAAADRIGELLLAVATTASARAHLAATPVLKGERFGQA